MQAAGSSTELSPHACQIPLPEPKRKCRSRAQESYVAERVPAPCLLLISPLVPGRVRVLVGGGGPGLTGGLLTPGSGKVSSPFPNLSAHVCEAPGQSPMHTHSRAHGLEFSPLIPLRPHRTSWAELTPPTSARPCPEPGVFARPHIPDPEAQSTGCTSQLWRPPAPQSLTGNL